MRVEYLKELEAIDDKKLAQHLQFTPEEYRSFVEHLLDRRIIERVKDGRYRFSYVGLLEYDQRFLLVMPKYLSDTDLLIKQNARLLMQLLMEYKTREKLDEEELETFGDIDNEDQFNYISLIDYLMNDYLEHGLYHDNIKRHELNGNGEIDWSKTIEENEAIISSRDVIYLDFHTRTEKDDEENFIRKLHKYVLQKCSDYMRNLEILGIFDYPVFDFELDEDELGELDFLLYKLETELNVQFVDRNVRLLKAMHHLLSREQGVSPQNSIVLFGSRSFYHVWEKVCGYVLGNQYEEFAAMIPRPTWDDFTSGKRDATDTLEPDILRRRPGQFFVFDAKYYTTAFNEKGQLINNTPGIADITKQYLYEMSLITPLKLEQLQRYNLFLLPGTTATEIFGKVSLPFFQGLSDIFLLRLNADTVYQMYIKRELFKPDFFDYIASIIDARRLEKPVS